MKSSTWSRVLPPLVTVAALLVIWQVVTVVREVPPLVLPPPTMIVEGIVAEFPRLLSNAGYTLSVLGLGYAVGVSIGLLLAVLVTAVPILRSALYPLAVASQSIPKIAIAPLLLIWFGYGLLPKVLVAFLVAFFPIVVNGASGLASVQSELLDLGRSLEATRWQTFWKFRMPSALPEIFGGMKIAMTLAVIGAIIGEFVGGNHGLGYLIMVANQEADTAYAFASIFLLSLMGVVLYLLVEFAERMLIPWNVSTVSQDLKAAS